MTATHQPTLPWITWHGYDLPLIPPDPLDHIWPGLPLEHICQTLAHIPRFNAAQRQLLPKTYNTDERPWSVAQHLLLCGLIVQDMWAAAFTDKHPSLSALAAALVHDVHEAFIGDIITPVAWALGPDAGQRLRQIKADVEAQLCASAPSSPLAICLRELQHNDVHLVDQLALRIERAAFVDWESDNIPWFGEPDSHHKPLLTESAAHTALRVASSVKFARLRTSTPDQAAKALAEEITHQGTRG